MKIGAFIATALTIAALAGPSIAFETPAGVDLGAAKALLTPVSCNVNDEDKQAYCMRACEERYVDSSSQYSKTVEERKAVRKDCESKCGC